ncbi:MAG TPA: YicC family protein [Kiritimatiellae bacterium]|nr:YicC family protein [Kiritimatiellia bacterium]
MGTEAPAADEVSMSVCSMSGHGEARASADGVAAAVHVRSYNRRHREIVVRISPEEWGFLAAEVGSRIGLVVTRGMVHCSIVIDLIGESAGCSIDVELAEHYGRLLRRLARRLSLRDGITLGDVIKLPGVVGIRRSARVRSKVRRVVLSAVSDALAGLEASRRFEGERLKRQLLALVKRLTAYLSRIDKRAAHVVVEYRRRMEKRLIELAGGAGVDLAAVNREIVLMAERSDISEELVRLQSHLEQAACTLGAGGACGRKLNFLAQEMMREINTLSAKARDVKVGDLAMGFRLDLEKFREQAQNLE